MSVTLPSGEEVKVNDHIYCSPPWAVRDGTPYSVARIMEFLLPEGSQKNSNSRRKYFDRVRLAWYYRPADVTERPVADSRLLLAAIYSEVVDINHLRAKCYVVHRDKISDLAGWKRRPDRFYFNRLFDPYIKKEFEVIASKDVRNIPEHIRENLVSRYEFVVAEKEVVPDLTDSIRLCHSCEAWCPNPETVQCDRCKKFFHMDCVQPPLLAKPSRGYGWTCAPCSRQYEEEVDSHEIRHVTPVASKPKSFAPAPRGRGRPRKDKVQAEKEENLPVKHYKMWPFRYFGLYTMAEDTLDPDDLIFPRTAIRVGPKFQTNVPAALTSNSIAPEIEERGGDHTVEILSIVTEMVPAEVAEMEAHLDKLTDDEDIKRDVDWLTDAVRRYSEALAANRPLSLVNMKSPMRLEKWKKQETRYTDKPWNRDEQVAFEDAILAHGAELRAVQDEVGTRSMPEVVRYYGHWKNARLGEDHARLRRHGPPSAKDTVAFNPVLDGLKQRVGLEDEDGSVIEDLGKSYSCGACRTKESKSWWKAPKNLATPVMCDNCGTAWRKYADLNVRPVREDSLPNGKSKSSSDKREGTPLTSGNTKRVRRSRSAQSTTPPMHHVSQVRCLACVKNGPSSKVLKCKQCQFKVHAASCGVVVDPSMVDSWLCDVCKNETTLEASVKTDCLLCPRSSRGKSKRKALNPPAESYLRACKPTEGQGWAHVLCSVFIPELSFTDATLLKKVEGISVIPQHRWATMCNLCGEEGGAVIRCGDCPKEFHVSCAWKHEYKFGFEIQPVKSSRRDITTVVTFKDESGAMSPIVSCKEHNSRREIYEICEMNEGGETALQVYCQRYKQAPIGQAHDLLRKARRLDQLLNGRHDAPAPPTGAGADIPLDKECQSCKTKFSPFFHSLSQGVWRCHKCTYKIKEEKTPCVVG